VDQSDHDDADGSSSGEIPPFDGVWANAVTAEACRNDLREVLEEWRLFRLANHLLLPAVDGIELQASRAACWRLSGRSRVLI
jgi:predicted RNase H-like HicB family nuclease